jgi:hypothetical protein
LVKLWETGELQRSRISPIIREIWELSASFHDFSLMYVHRSCNHVAHTLAKPVSDGNRMGEWHWAPTCIANLLIEDCNHDASWLIKDFIITKKKQKAEPPCVYIYQCRGCYGNCSRRVASFPLVPPRMKYKMLFFACFIIFGGFLGNDS